MFISAVLTMEELVKETMTNLGGKGKDRDVAGADFLNRKPDVGHINSISNYLVQQDKWTLGSVTVNVSEPIQIYVFGEAHVVLGYAVLPEHVKKMITDGQHRRLAVGEALKHREEIKYDGIVVIISQESDVEQVRADFAAMGQTRPIDKSLLVTYNTSDLHVSMVKEIIDNCTVFRGRIQPEGTSIPKSSEYHLFTANQLSQGIAELLYGGSDKPSKAKGLRDYKEPTEREKRVKKALWFYDTYAEYGPNDGWRALLADLRYTQKTLALSKWREKRLDCKVTGLRILGQVAHSILFNFSEDFPNLPENERTQEALIKLLATKIEFDLSKKEATDFWTACGVWINNTSVANQLNTIRQGGDAVRVRLNELATADLKTFQAL